MENNFPRTVSLPSFDKHPAKESPDAVWDALPNPVLLKKEAFLSNSNSKSRKRFLLQFGGCALAGLCIFVIVLFHGALYAEPQEGVAERANRVQRSVTPPQPQAQLSPPESSEMKSFNSEKYRPFPGSKKYQYQDEKKYYKKSKKYGKPIRFDESPELYGS